MGTHSGIRVLRLLNLSKRPPLKKPDYLVSKSLPKLSRRAGRFLKEFDISLSRPKNK